VTAEKTYETRLRRMADRQGLALRKSRRRDPRARDFGEIWLQWLDAPTPDQTYDAWVGPFESLELVEEWLNADQDERGHNRRTLEEWRGY
jgi:hypothetical protein